MMTCTVLVCGGYTAKFFSCSAVYFLRGSFTWGEDIIEEVTVDLLIGSVIVITKSVNDKYTGTALTIVGPYAKRSRVAQSG